MTNKTKSLELKEIKLAPTATVAEAQKNILEIQVTLNSVEPAVWRLLEVYEDSSLEELHQAIQCSMGWTCSHLYSFSVGGKKGRRTTYSSEEFELDDAESSEETTLSDIVRAGINEFEYLYDFGDGWEHTIKIVGKPKLAENKIKYPICSAGAMACPPEDCGGPHGYMNLCAVLSDPSDEEYKEMRKWTGKGFDPSKFSVAKANKELQSKLW